MFTQPLRHPITGRRGVGPGGCIALYGQPANLIIEDLASCYESSAWVLEQSALEGIQRHLSFLFCFFGGIDEAKRRFVAEQSCFFA